MAGEDAEDVFGEGAGHGGAGGFGGAGGVRGEEHAIEAAKAVVDVGLPLEDVEGGGREVTALEGAGESGFVDHGAASGVHQDRARLHAREGGGVDEMPRGAGERNVERDEVAFREQLGERNVTRAELDEGLDIVKSVLTKAAEVAA